MSFPQKQVIATIRQFVECESPSDDPAGLNRFVDLFAETVKDIARVKTYPGGKSHGKHLRCEFLLPGSKVKKSGKSGHILALGHSDTVWPLGILRTMPFRQEQGRLWGPGVFDMKAGLVFFIFAMRALRDEGLPIARRVVLQVNSDEEVGSPSSRPLTEEAARASAAVLVLEPSQGLDGKLKTARKGVGDYTVTARGRAAHAGLDFLNGASAIVEMARQIQKIAGFTRLDRGITVSPGLIQGGTRSNVIAAECRVEVDVRAPKASDARYLERHFASLKPFDKRCTINVTGGMNRPPLERTAGVRALFRKAKALAAELGVDLQESSAGGGSDGNFTAALGVPTLDGLGAVGEGAHAANESILIDRMADRIALLSKLVAAV
ncbi:MAG: M20 family metallopeptidase [Acidobacteriota bacterium]